MLFSRLKIKDIELGCFFAAIFVYAFFSAPTPDRLGVAEIIIALFFALAFLRTFLASFMVGPQAARFLLIYGLSIPVFLGVVQGNDFVSMMRDVIAFLFFLLPLFAARLLDDELRTGYLVSVFVCLGLVFSARALWDMIQIGPDSLAYFANTSGVLFAAVFLLGRAAQDQRKILRPFLFFVAALLVLLVMGLTLQRASLGYIALSSLCFLFVVFQANRVRGLFVLGFILVFMMIFWGEITDVAGALLQKTLLFGGNMRLAELQAVWGDVTDSFWHFVFGRGWGASFESPAVAGIRVNYTHSLFTALFLKTGLVGAGLAAFYLFALLQRLGVIFRQDFVFAAALFGPFLIGTFLYASYKSLDYGILLLLIFVGSRLRPIASTGQDV